MHARLFACALGLTLAVAACGGSSSTEITAPSTSKCEITLQNSMTGPAPAAGATGSLTVTTTRDCTWNATVDAAWVKITSGSSGQGNGGVAYTVSANEQPAQRRTEIHVNDTAATIVQDAAECKFTVAGDNTSVAAAGGTVKVNVQTLAGCTWNAQSNAPWLSIAAISSGSGNGTVTFTAAPNEGDARSATVTVGGTTITVNQAAAPCTFTVAPLTQNVAAGGGRGSVEISVRSGCSWTAASDAAWITITSPSSGKGNGSIAWQAAANAGDARTGTLSIAGMTVTIMQAPAPCTFTVSPLTQNVPVEGGAGTAAVMVRPGCAWTAVSNTPWITITSGASGNGNGIVSFTIQPNPEPPRTGTLTIAGFTFTVSQATVPCDYAIWPPQQLIGAGGGTGGADITTGPTCPWTSTSNVPWIAILSGASGIGSGRTVIRIDSNAGPARTGTVTIATRTYTVFQDGR